MNESGKEAAYICQGCGSIYWVEVNCDCNTKSAFDMVLVSPIAQPEQLTDVGAVELSDSEIRLLCKGWFDVDGKTIHCRSGSTNITEQIMGVVREAINAAIEQPKDKP